MAKFFDYLVITSWAIGIVLCLLSGVAVDAGASLGTLTPDKVLPFVVVLWAPAASYGVVEVIGKFFNN
jgi:hypothetical protein